jgi:hypothetical protein
MRPFGKVGRLYLKPDGSFVSVYLSPCRCLVGQRGPSGGVCGRCGEAILTELERKSIEDQYNNGKF